MNCFHAEVFATVMTGMPFWPGVVCLIPLMAAAWVVVAPSNHPVDVDRRWTDKMLAEIAEKAPVPLVQVGSDGIIQWANLAQLELFGYARQEYVGRKAVEFYANEAEGVSMLARLMRGETLRDCPANLRARDGTLHDVLISSSTDMENGRFLRTRLFTQDVTGRRRAEEEILRLNQELEERVHQRTAQLEAANKEMESFSYSVSHDLRAPLRSLRGFTEVLLELHASQLDSRGQDFLRRACAASFHMERLIEDLLKLAQVSRADIQMEQVNLSSLAREIASELAGSDASRTVEFMIASDCSVQGDPRLLRLALDNLLRNAWKFSAKRPDARIEFGKTEGPEPAFFVRDNGAGFNMTYSNRLFGVFQRLHAASEFPGTGVGLATVQRIINRHGGRTWAIGAVNEGATFYFALPEKNKETNTAAHPS
jgi:PAS domain S-box-containing protein